MPRVSVVIPCYNQGQFIDEAVTSVLDQSFQDLEIVIVNDGSTDPATNALLGDYRRPKTRVITTDNQGLAAARNNGIAVAEGDYILPLDADDKIAPGYVEKAAGILDHRSDIGIVYCRAMLFGQADTEWLLPEYSLAEMLIDNIIFCTAMFRRSDWLLVGGYDTGMIYGWEDYEFWLSLIERGRGVYRIPELLFFYRVASDSMVRSLEKEKKISMFNRIFSRHTQLFCDNIDVWIDRILTAKECYFTARLYIDTGDGVSDTQSVARKVGKETFRLVFDIGNFEKIVNLRFDPVDTYAVVTIKRVVLRKKDGSIFEVREINGNEAYREGERLFFTTDDPQCFFNVDSSQCNDLDEVCIDLVFHSFAEEALAEIVQFQRKILSDTRKAITESERRGITAAIKGALKR